MCSAERGEQRRHVDVVRVEEPDRRDDEQHRAGAIAATPGQPRVAEHREQREERRQRVVAALAREDPERHEREQRRHRGVGGEAPAPERPRQREHGRHAGRAEQRGRQPCRHRPVAEQRERTCHQVEVEPGVPAPGPAGLGLDPEFLRERVAPVIAERDAVLERRTRQQRRLGFVLPQELRSEIGEGEPTGQRDREREGDRIAAPEARLFGAGRMPGARVAPIALARAFARRRRGLQSSSARHVFRSPARQLGLGDATRVG